MNCPVCGHPDKACAGNVRTNERQIITSDGVVNRKGPERMPLRQGGIGKAGYVGMATGQVETYDPKYPNVRLVQDDDEEAVTGDGDAIATPPDSGAIASTDTTITTGTASRHPGLKDSPKRTRKPQT